MANVIRILTEKDKEALSKEDVVDILNECSDIRLKTYVMLLAASGFRAVEALSVRIKDLDLDSKPALVFIRGEYTKTKADRIGKGEREDSNQNRRQITLHSFRRFVKTTISDLGYFDFSEYFIGHIGSTYWRKKDSEKAEIFRKIEPYLTFLNVNQLERQGADIQSKIEELEELNQSFRERDKMKDDAIAHLSDQLMALAARMQDLERREDT